MTCKYFPEYSLGKHNCCSLQMSPNPNCPFPHKGFIYLHCLMMVLCIYIFPYLVCRTNVCILAQSSSSCWCKEPLNMSNLIRGCPRMLLRKEYPQDSVHAMLSERAAKWGEMLNWKEMDVPTDSSFI